MASDSSTLRRQSSKRSRDDRLSIDTLLKPGSEFEPGHYRRSSEDIVRRFLRRNYGEKEGVDVPAKRARARLTTDSPPRTPRLGHRPGGLSEGLERIPSAVFRFDPERVSLRSRSEDGSLIVSPPLPSSSQIPPPTSPPKSPATLQRKKSSRWRSIKKGVRKRLKRQKTVDESCRQSSDVLLAQKTMALELNDGVDSGGASAGVNNDFQQESSSQESSQESSSQESLRKKRPSLLDKIGSFFNRFSGNTDAVDYNDGNNDEDEDDRSPQASRAIIRKSVGRRSSYHEAMDSMYFPLPNDDEYAQEILADSARPAAVASGGGRGGSGSATSDASCDMTAEAAALDAVIQESVVDKLEEIGKRIEERLGEDLNSIAKNVDIASLQYSDFRQLAEEVVVQGARATRTGVMKLLLFSKKVVGLLPWQLVSLRERVEDYASKAVEDLAGDFIATNGGFTGIAEELSEDESFYEMNDVKRVQSTEI